MPLGLAGGSSQPSLGRAAANGAAALRSTFSTARDSRGVPPPPAGKAMPVPLMPPVSDTPKSGKPSNAAGLSVDLGGGGASASAGSGAARRASARAGGVFSGGVGSTLVGSGGFFFF